MSNLKTNAMKKLSLLIPLILSSLIAISQIINIPDDYPTIQQGINAANIGDTVLVDTGVYVENINFNGKNITVASNFLMTLDTSYVSQTVIDGNQNGSVVTFDSGEDSTAILIGFTLKNGYTIKGGGIRCENADPVLKFLKIYNNTAHGIIEMYGNGGGMYCSNSSVSLSNVMIVNNTSIADFPIGGGFHCQESNVLMQNVTISNNTMIKTGGGKYGAGGGITCSSSTITMRNVTISNNYSIHKGGGIHCTNSIIVFDTIERSNIYDNIALIGNDIFIQNSDPLFIALDTFSVLIPTEYYIESSNNFNYSINYGLREQVDADLYISPNGSNENSGLTQEDPLQTINYGLSIQLVDSLHAHTIHLLNGTYSVSNNNEIYPINLPEGLNLIGESKEGVILDAEGLADVIWVSDNMNSIISNLTITNGDSWFTGGGITSRNSNLYLNNLIISNNIAGGPCGYSGGGICSYSSNLTIENTTITNNAAGGDSWGGGIAFFDSNLNIFNSIISENEALDGGGIYSSGGTIILKNVLISANTSDWGGGIYVRQTEATLINVNIVDNIAIDYYGGGILTSSSDLIITNSIIRDNIPNEIFMSEDTLTISNSNLLDGINGIINNTYGMVNWLEGNIDEDPMFEGLGNHPYQLNSNSPCIDSGTPDTTELNLPEYDLAGEVRIFNDRIDIGAYEWNSLGYEESVFLNQRLLMQCFPNPFTTYTTLSYELKQPEKVVLTIYNHLGQLIYQTQENQQQGKQQFIWNAEVYPDGVYYYRLQIGELVANGKMVKVR